MYYHKILPFRETYDIFSTAWGATRMDGNSKGFLKTTWDGFFVTGSMSVGDVLREAFRTPLRAAVITVATIVIIGSSVVVWTQIIEPALFAPPSDINAIVLYDDGSKGLAPSLDKPFRCSPEFPLNNDVSKQIKDECTQ